LVKPQPVRRKRRWGTRHYLRRARSQRRTERNAWMLMLFVTTFCVVTLLLAI